MKTQEELQDAADRAFELLERKSPHQLAVELVSMEGRVQTAIDACARMQELRDQLASQLKDATAQCGGMAELLREAAPMISGYGNSTHNYAYRDEDYAESERAYDLEGRIDAALAGKLPEPGVPKGWQLEALDNDCIVVRKDGVGAYAASFNAENIASTILHALASDMLAGTPKPEGGA